MAARIGEENERQVLLRLTGGGEGQEKRRGGDRGWGGRVANPRSLLEEVWLSACRLGWEAELEHGGAAPGLVWTEERSLWGGRDAHAPLGRGCGGSWMATKVSVRRTMQFQSARMMSSCATCDVVRELASGLRARHWKGTRDQIPGQSVPRKLVDSLGGETVASGTGCAP